MRLIVILNGVEGEMCFGRDGFSDIGPGTEVTVRNESDIIVGKSVLGRGVKVPFDDADDGYLACQFEFIPVKNIPVAPFYSITVSHRKGLTYSAADLDKQGWRVELFLG